MMNPLESNWSPEQSTVNSTLHKALGTLHTKQRCTKTDSELQHAGFGTWFSHDIKQQQNYASILETSLVL